MIYYPKIYGTCSGASRAVAAAYKLSNKKNAYIYKEILHNPVIIKDLEKKGIKCVDNLKLFKMHDNVVIRAHGEPKETIKFFEENQINYIDATCPKVIGVHKIVEEKYNDDYQIIIVGKKKHPEVIGTNGWCNNNAILIESMEEIENLKILNEKIYVVAQTTISEEKYLQIIDSLLKKYPKLEYKNTICSAQKLIQTSSLELASKMDLMLVIGGSDSSNTKELYNVCKSACESYLFSNISDFYNFIKKHNIDDDTKIGLTGGASTPKKQIEEYRKLLEFIIYYRKMKQKFEKDIKKYNDSFILKDNKIITDAIKKFIDMNSDGKYVRAMLIDLGYKINGKKDDYAIPLALAYETFQTSVLIHDDIIDKAKLRRGKPTIPTMYETEFNKHSIKDKKYQNESSDISNSLGICLGDLGFYYTNQIILNNYSTDKNILKVLNYYNDIVINTIKGEILDIILPFNEKYAKKTSVKEKDVMEIYKLKTAYYSIIGPFTLGLILGNTSDEIINKIEKILLNLGISFQIKDDLLGIFGDSDKVGKSTYSDIKEFKQTILYTYINEYAREYKDELLKYYGQSKLNKSDIIRVKNIFDLSKAKEYAISKMDSLFEIAEKELFKIDIPLKYKEILEGFIIYLKIRDM